MLGFQPNMQTNDPPSFATRLFSHRWQPYAIIIALTALVWGHTVRFEFTWDDIDLIQRLESIRSFRNLPEMFTSLEAQSAWPEGFKLFRPIRLVACALLFQIGGGVEPQPWLFHLANVLCHGVAACLLYIITTRLFIKLLPEVEPWRQRLFALWAAVAYAVHPVVSEVVCWAKALDDELATIFTLAAVACVLRWERERQSVIGALTFYLLALYSKISSAPFAAVVLILARWAHGLPWTVSLKRTTPFIVAAVVFMMHRHHVIGQSSQTTPISGTYAQTLIDMLPVVPQYLKLLCGAPPFYIDYGFQTGGRSLASLPVLGGIALLIAMAIIAARTLPRSRTRFVAVALAWIGLFILPVSNLLPMMQYMAERFLYLPLIGWLLLTAGVLMRIQNWRLATGVATAALVFWAGTAWDRSLLWRDNLTLFVQSSQQQPHSQRVVNNAIGAIFAQPQVATFFRFANLQRDLTIVRIPEPSERPPLRATLEVAYNLFPDDPTTLHALAQLETWDGNTAKAETFRQLATAKPVPAKLAGEPKE